MWPTLFVSHGSPTVAIDDTPAHRFLSALGRRLWRPRAILCCSAHWETGWPAVTGSPAPATIHDFYGFPPPLYELRYPAPGDPELAREVVEMLREAGLAAEVDPGRGLDHGAWIPLLLVYPEADIPVLQLSVQTPLGPEHHWRTGEVLAKLRRRDVLLMGSGALTHNLADALGRLRRGVTSTSEPVPRWAVEFDAWMTRAVEAGAREDLLAYRRRAPHAAYAHPTEEHILPLFFAAGAGGGRGRKVHDSFEFGSLSMAVFAFPDLPQGGGRG
ncbi:4,5-DOPA dioxygenase extradiol [bacterium HR39]|nr:4,5-DOPA dioxygenase extradiol [bacterium HR39]